MKTTSGCPSVSWTTVRFGAARWRVAPGDEALVDRLKQLRYRRIRDVAGLEILKEADHVFWARLEIAGQAWFLKGYRSTGLRRLWKSLFAPSDMQQEWRKTWWLRSTGIETARPAAVGAVRRLGAIVEAYIVYRWVPGARNLITYLVEKDAELPRRSFERLRRNVAFQLGKLFGSLHAVGAYHRQFHDRNILVAEDDRGGVRLLPIDLDHLTICGQLTEEDRDWNFYQLAWHLRRTISRWKPRASDAARFLKGYLLAEPTCAPSWRELFRRFSAFVPREPLAERPRREEWRR